jgi:hypothetical protein
MDTIWPFLVLFAIALGLAGISFLLGIVAKIGIAFAMLGLFALAWFT